MTARAMKCPACDAPGCRVTETKTGGLSASCPSCGYQGFAKSPKAVAGLQQRMAGGEPPKEKPKGGDSWLDEL